MNKSCDVATFTFVEIVPELPTNPKRTDATNQHTHTTNVLTMLSARVATRAVAGVQRQQKRGIVDYLTKVPDNVSEGGEGGNGERERELVCVVNRIE